jgi:hypothetical protein
VQAAHEAGLVVEPLAGASSLTLALAASGLNGQRFAFEGYLPQNAAERAHRVRELEQRSRKEGQTQLAIETPYRNQALLESLVQLLQPGTPERGLRPDLARRLLPDAQRVTVAQHAPAGHAGQAASGLPLAGRLRPAPDQALEPPPSKAATLRLGRMLGETRPADAAGWKARCAPRRPARRSPAS